MHGTIVHAYINRRLRFRCWAALLLVLPACDSTMPSTRLRSGVRLPVPLTSAELPGPERLSRVDRGEVFRLTPRKLISLAFSRQPDIMSSYERFKSEESRYDFFVVSRDSLTPSLSTSNVVSERREDETVERRRGHVVEFAIEKLFFDTTELNVGFGINTQAENEAIGYRPFVSADLRYPLWVSRRKLERTSEDIFRRNELNDAQLDYIQTVRRRLQNTLFRYYEVMSFAREIDNLQRWRDDLIDLQSRIDAVVGRDVASDRSRVEAELAKVQADLRETAGRFEIERERLKASSGLPFHARVEFIDEPFNPFEGATHEDLLAVSIETDPEIATLRNEQRNAEVQLDLARRGRWDVTLLLNGRSNLEGAGEDEGVSDWSASFGIDISAVDPRVTTSLASQADARIARFKQAIIARENDIFVDTFEPIVRIETLTAGRGELVRNLPRFQRDFATGLEEFTAGTLNIDDLLKRREELFDQEEDISRRTFVIGANVAELCSATGKFFEFIQQDNGHGG